MPIYTKKSNGTWSTNAKKIFAKIGSSTWASAKAVFVKTTNGWIQAWPGNAPSVRPSDPISLRLTSYSGPLADTTFFEYIDTVMYGDDGSYDGDPVIQIDNTSRKMVYYPDTSTNSTRTTIETSDVFNLSNNSLTDVDGVDGKYVRYSLRAFNNSGELEAFSEPVRVIRKTPEFASTILLDIDASLSEIYTLYALEFNVKNSWFNCVDLSRSYVRWWRHTDTTNYRNGTILQTDYLNSSTIGGRFNRYGSYTRGDGTNLNGESFITVMANDLPAGNYVIGEVVLFNSYTDYYNNEVVQSKASDAIPIVSNVRFLDMNGETAIDSRGDIVSDALWDLKFQVSGVTASTKYRVQYRLYNDSATSNWYRDFDGSDADWENSDTWKTSFNSDGSGDGYLSEVNVVGTTAYIEDRAFINTALLTGSPTYGGGLKRWHLEYRISVQNPGQARVYYNGTPENGSYFHFGSSGGTFEIMPSTVPTLTATPLTGTAPLSVSFTVTTNSYPSGNASYPRAIGIDYGDGSAIDWQYYSSSSNPTRTVNKTYSSGGTFTATVRTIPQGDTSRGTRSRTISAISRPSAPNTLTASTNRTDGVLLQWDLPSSQSANYYEIYWQSSQGTGPVNQSTFADFGRSGDTANAITSKSFLDTTISSGSTRYYRVRARNSSDTTDPNFCSDWFPSPGNNAITGTRITANLTAPTITNVPTMTAGGAVSAFFTGGSGPAYQMYWTTGVAPTFSVTPDASGTSSPLTDNTGPTTASSGSVRWFMYVRSVATVGETSVGPSSVASAWSAGYEFTVLAATTYGACEVWYTSTTYECDTPPLQFNRDVTTTYYRRKILVGGVWDGSSYDYSQTACAPTVSYGSWKVTDGRCGYVTPPFRYYCTTNYTNPQLPDEQYPSDTDQTGSACGSYNTVCSYNNTGSYPSAPLAPACTTTTTTTTTTTACTCVYQDMGSYHFSPQCCPSGSPRTGSLSGTSSGSCCPNVNKTQKWNCNSFDVNNSSSANYFVCFYVGECAATSNSAGTRTVCYV